jgi:hypothetical protein
MSSADVEVLQIKYATTLHAQEAFCSLAQNRRHRRRTFHQIDIVISLFVTSVRYNTKHITEQKGAV